MELLKLALFILVLLTGTNSFSQISISGQVIDSETKNPIESVYIQNRNQPQYSTLSDDHGLFHIVGKMSDTLDFHRIGYTFVSYVCSEKNEISMTMNPIEYDLSEVAISYESAEKILQKAFFNLRKQYTHETLNYLWHGDKKEKRRGDRKESYALYEVKVGKVNPSKKEKIPFEFRLLDINHLITSSNKMRNGNARFYPSLIDWTTNNKNIRIIKIDNDNDSLLFINCVTKQSEKNKLHFRADFIINKSDTVLLYYSSNLLNPISEKDSITQYDKARFLFLTWTFKIREDITKFSIKKNENGYYFDSFYSKILISFLEDKKEKLIDLEQMSTAILHPVNTGIENKKKLVGMSNQMFKLPATTTERFWEKQAD
jgi:hypothetical protein